ncbi:MAG: glyoxalase [Roseobacter sp.]
MDLETVSPDVFGKSLRGIGLNVLVHNVRATCDFLRAVFEMGVHRQSDDFAIVTYGTGIFQLHRDGTYAENPLLNLLPENPPRGAGLEIRLYDTDPDLAVKRATALGAAILQAPTEKPHGLREAYILCDDGYAWVPSRPL